MNRKNSPRGFTLIEFVIVIAIIGIIAATAVPIYTGYIERAHSTADWVTLGFLNRTTTSYATSKQVTLGDVFEGFTTDEQRLTELMDEGFLSEITLPKQKDVAFAWSIEEQQWLLINADSTIPLSPLGSSFTGVSLAMIDLINQRLINIGSYGRTWGDYAYTDIGLDPDDWKNPVAHIYFKPKGSQLRISPEEGYTFVVNDLNGNTKNLSYLLNWDLIYNDLDNKWYYHSILASNVIDISTLKVRQ